MRIAKVLLSAMLILSMSQIVLAASGTIEYYKVFNDTYEGYLSGAEIREGNVTIVAYVNTTQFIAPKISVNQYGLLDMGSFGAAWGEYNNSEEMPAQSMTLIDTNVDLTESVITISSDPGGISENLVDHDRSSSWNSAPGVQSVTVEINLSATSLNPRIEKVDKVVIVQSDMNNDTARNIEIVDVYYYDGSKYVYVDQYTLNTGLNVVNNITFPALNTTRMRFVMTNAGSNFGTALKEIEVYNERQDRTVWKYEYAVHKATKFFNVLPGFDAYLDGPATVYVNESNGAPIALSGNSFKINTTKNERVFFDAGDINVTVENARRVFFSAGNITVNVENARGVFFSAGNITVNVSYPDENAVNIYYNHNQSAVPAGNLTILAIFTKEQNDVTPPLIAIDQQGLCDVGHFYQSEYDASCDVDMQPMTHIQNNGSLVEAYKDVSTAAGNMTNLFDKDRTTEWTGLPGKTEVVIEVNLSNTDGDYPINWINQIVLVQGNQFGDPTRNIEAINVSYWNGTVFVPMVNMSGLNTSTGYANVINFPIVSTNRLKIRMRNNGNMLSTIARELEVRYNMKNFTYWKYVYNVHTKTGDFAGLDTYVDGNATIYINDSNGWNIQTFNNTFYIQSVPLNRKPVLLTLPKIYVEGMGPMSRSPFVADVVECYKGEYYDADNETQNRTEWKWRVEGLEVSSEKTLNLSAFNQQDEVVCSQRVYDGVQWSDWYDSMPVEINGSQPIMSEFSVNYTLPIQKGKVVQFSVNVNDPDGDSSRLYVCRSLGTNESWCQNPYCVSSLTASGGNAECSFDTSEISIVGDPVNYSFYAYVCDTKGKCSTIPMGGNLTVFGAVSKEIALRKGWNLIAMPAVPIDKYGHDKNLTADELMNMTGAIMVVKYNSSKQKFVSHISPGINDFVVDLSESYYVYSPRDVIVEFVGKPIVTISKQLHNGWNFVNYPSQQQVNQIFSNRPRFRNIVGYHTGRLLNYDVDSPSVSYRTESGYGIMVYHEGIDEYNFSG